MQVVNEGKKLKVHVYTNPLLEGSRKAIQVYILVELNSFQRHRARNWMPRISESMGKGT